jgi:hypothetical protein
MPDGDFAKVFILRRDHYTHRPYVPAPASIPRSKPAKSAVPSGQKSAVDQARLAELREALKKSEEAADAEYKAQAAKLALDAIKEKLTSLDEIEQKRSELDSTLAGLKACETLPQNIAELIETYERLQGPKIPAFGHPHRGHHCKQIFHRRNFLADPFDSGAVYNSCSIRILFSGGCSCVDWAHGSSVVQRFP